eukprot:2545657-Rhodomonas_salina.1
MTLTFDVLSVFLSVSLSVCLRGRRLLARVARRKENSAALSSALLEELCALRFCSADALKGADAWGRPAARLAFPTVAQAAGLPPPPPERRKLLPAEVCACRAGCLDFCFAFLLLLLDVGWLLVRWNLSSLVC